MKAMKTWVVIESYDEDLIRQYNEDEDMAKNLSLTFNDESLSEDIKDSLEISIQKAILIISDISSVRQAYINNKNVKKECLLTIRESFANLKNFDITNIPVLHISTKSGDYFTILGIIEIMFPHFKFKTDAKT